MSALQLYNSYSRKKENFEPVTPGYVGLYVCGPTVSGESHMGHARPYITFDVVNRWLQHLGYKVRYVRNITDAGHFEEEGREAIDKVGEKAKLEQLEPMELVQKYTNLFHWGMREFNNLEPNIEPTATGHIIEQISMIRDIMEKGYAYEVNGSVYFDLKKYAADHPYGTLSGRVIDELLETTRDLDGQEEKRNKIDFALWKKAPDKHLMRWESPWGTGFPGWHIECSAMSSKYLGKEFDIHGGGMDLQFPHHESEIAQSTIAHGHAPARYWMHNNMITIIGKKMGKSYNNVIKLTELFSGDHPILEQAYHPMVVRFYILQTHYRSTLDFSNEALQASERALTRLWEAYDLLKQMKHTATENLDEELNNLIRQKCEDCTLFMNDDFNTARVIASLFELVPVINSIKGGQIKLSAVSKENFELLQNSFRIFIKEVLGLLPLQKENLQLLDPVIELLISLRKEAKAKKDYAASDKIRNQLMESGILLKDEKDGTVSYSIRQ